MTDNTEEKTGKTLPEAALRALEEAEARRAAAAEKALIESGTTQEEIGGRKGPEPVRYGDWEKDGIISDF